MKQRGILTKSKQARLKNLRPPFPKGVSGNPKGRPPDALGKQMRQLTASDFAEIADLIVKGNLAQLQRIGKDPSSSALKVLISAIVIKAIQKGDMGALDTLLNRLVGKVKEKIEISGADGAPLQVESKMAVLRLMEDPESFAHLSALEKKVNGDKPPSSDSK